MENNKLVKVTNDFNTGGVLELDFNAMLSDIRTILEGESPVLMTEDDFFLISGSPLALNNESITSLNSIMTAPLSGPYILTVGNGSVPISDLTDWTLMSEGQKATVLNTVAQVTKGLSLSADQGLYKVTFDAIKPMVSGVSEWTSDIPRIQTSVTTNSYFSKYASSLATSSSNGGSLSVDTPYGSGSASYDQAKSQESGKSTVTTYSVGTYNVNKVDVVLDQTQFELTDNFFNALSNAASLTDGQSQFVGIVQALNKYGWYLPVNLTLGGALLTIQQSESESWSQSQSTTDTFGASFKASFDGIGGGAAYNSSNTSKTTSSGSNGSDSLSFTAIGGSAADSNNFTNWAKSLAPASAWSTSAYNQMIPSLYPLLNMGGDNKAMLYFIKNMMAQQYSGCIELEQLQPLIDVGAYLTALNNLLPSPGE
jgi:hypothetical protein